METLWRLFLIIFISAFSHLAACAPAANQLARSSSARSSDWGIQKSEKRRRPKIEIFELEQKFNAYCIRYRVSGRPAPTKLWHLNGTLLDFERFEGVKDKNYSSLNANGTRYAMRSETADGEQDGCLEIAARSHLLSGNYSLSVRNELGEASETKQVVLFTHPGPSASPELDELAKGRAGLTPPAPLPSDKASDDSSIIFSVSINFIVLMLSLLLTSLFFYLACVRYLNHKSRKRSSHKPTNGQDGRLSLDLSKVRFVTFVDNPNYLAQKKQYLKIKGIHHVESERIQLLEYLGEGEFGRVFLGTLETGANEKTMVAVKVLKVKTFFCAFLFDSIDIVCLASTPTRTR